MFVFELSKLGLHSIQVRIKQKIYLN